MGAETSSTKDDDDPLTLRTRFVFLGAGGGALTLLQKSGIPEGKGYGAFRFPASSSATAIPKRPRNTTPKCTAKPPSAHPQCPFRIWIPATWTVNAI